MFVRLRSHRRLWALLHLLVFAFSASTALLPCGNAPSGPAGSHHGAMISAAPSDVESEHGAHGTVPPVSMAHHHDAGHAATSDPTPPPPPQDAHDAVCPLVIGCVGMMQWALDASLVSRESVVGSGVPRGITLARVNADRSVDSPPPRA